MLRGFIAVFCRQTHDNLEHLAIMERVLGPIPASMIRETKYVQSITYINRLIALPYCHYSIHQGHNQDFHLLGGIQYWWRTCCTSSLFLGRKHVSR